VTVRLPWPPVAEGERDRAGFLLHLLLFEARALKRLTRNGLNPEILRQIGSDIHDYASEGYRILERDWPEIRKWPDRANEARLSAIDAFYDAIVNGRRVRELIKGGRQKYHRSELQEMADDMTYIINDAINLMVAMGAPRLLLGDEPNNEE